MPASTGATYLFVPSHKPRFLAAARRSGADHIVLDLEDGVATADKEAARAGLGDWVRDGGASRDTWVRVNPRESALQIEDIIAVGEAGLHRYVVPKVAQAADVREFVGRVARYGAACDPEVIPLVETASAVLDAASIAGQHGVVRLAMGEADLRTDLGLDHVAMEAHEDEPGPVAAARASVVLASAATARPSPIASPWFRLNDDDGLIRTTQDLRRLGFGARLCVHPSQVEPVRQAFEPTDEQRRWAEQVLAARRRAGEGGTGAVRTEDGEMVDGPMFRRAVQIAGSAERSK